MPINKVMKLFFPVLLILCGSLFAAPLENGYSLAPKAAASGEEKAKAYLNARQKVIEAAKKYEGTPYLYGGMTKSGLDCSGFICLSFKDAIGVALPRSASGIYTWTERIPLEKIQPGDFLFFRTGTNSSITHVALYVGGRRFIHSASSGTKTGVIYTGLDDQYWIKAYAGAGRAFPEIPSGFSIDNNTSIANNDAGKKDKALINKQDISFSGDKGRLLAGAAFAPVWNGFIKGGELVRGISTQLYIYADTYSFNSRMVFGLELRPEYDMAFGVFSLPITFSWGPNEKIRIFAGPVLALGEAELSTEDGTRRYSSGANWLGTIGITAAPFTIPSSVGDFNPYIELVWQSYFSENQSFDFASDLSAGFRFSTGIRWLIQVK